MISAQYWTIVSMNMTPIASTEKVSHINSQYKEKIRKLQKEEEERYKEKIITKEKERKRKSETGSKRKNIGLQVIRMEKDTSASFIEKLQLY